MRIQVYVFVDLKVAGTSNSDSDLEPFFNI